jgi:hypothetical protein
VPAISVPELRAVEEAVRAVVARDDERLSTLAPDVDDLYLWTRDYGRFGAVELVMPPGDAAAWALEVVVTAQGTKHVVVPMWTRQEGRSDLALELEVREGEPGKWTARILDLHLP